MEIKGQNAKVFIVNKKTGEQRELPGAVGSICVGECETKQEEDGHCSFNFEVKAEAHINRKSRKFIRHLVGPVRPPKYISKTIIAQNILYRFINCKKTYDELMKMSHKDLMIYFVQLYVAHEMVLAGLPKGGIVRSEVCANAEMVISREKAHEMGKLLTRK